MGVQVAHELSQTPQVSTKLKTQMKDPINGNYLIASVMYPNANERWIHYKAFFAIQDPRKGTPDRTRKLNFKIEPLLKHMNAIFQQAWILGPEASVDEHIIDFQGNHICKLCITTSHG